MGKFEACIALCLLNLGSAVVTAGSLRHVGSAEGFVRALEFQHSLRVCNAYPLSGELDVFRGKSEKLTGESPMPYKSCRDFKAPLKSGDKLEFKVGDATAGTFAISDLPNNDAVLMLVIHRHDTISSAVAFESHVFSNLQNAQVAVIDTYKGKAQSKPRIMDEASGDKKKQARSEELRFDSVVALNPGKYEVVLAGDDGETKAMSALVALDSQSYVVLRTGVESEDGQAFPQELVVYPESDASQIHSAAVGASPFAFLVFALAAATTGCW